MPTTRVAHLSLYTVRDAVERTGYPRYRVPNEGVISEGDPICVIDPAECANCGTCEEVCPSDVILDM